MGYLQYLRLRWLQFVRSPFFQRKLLVKLFLGAFLFLFYLEVIAFGVGTYYLLQQLDPSADLFRLLNRYDYMFFMLALSLILMGANTVSFDYKPLLLLPVRKSRLAWFHITDYFLTWPYLFLATWLVTVITVFRLNGYDAGPLIRWGIIMFLLSLWLGVIYFIAEKHPLLNFLASLLMFGAMLTARTAPRYLGFIGDTIYRLAMHPAGVAGVFLLTTALYGSVHAYLRRRMYLDSGRHAAPKQPAWASDSKWEKFIGGRSIHRAFITNDIRLLLRNSFPKSVLYSALFMLVLAGIFFFAPVYRHNTFMKIFAALMVSGTFMYNFGGMIPAWDSQYFKLLMSQGIRYRDYIEAKWRLLVYSVVLLTVLALPYLFIDRQIYLLILVFALFNAGLNVYVMLATGILNATPVKLNEKVKAFRTTQSFSGKIMLANLLRILLPVGLYFSLAKIFNEQTALTVLAVLGLTGLMLRRYFLDALAQAYARHKYEWIEKFSTG